MSVCYWFVCDETKTRFDVNQGDWYTKFPVSDQSATHLMNFAEMPDLAERIQRVTYRGSPIADDEYAREVASWLVAWAGGRYVYLIDDMGDEADRVYKTYALVGTRLRKDWSSQGRYIGEPM